MCEVGVWGFQFRVVWVFLGWCVWYGLVMVMVGFGVVVSGVWFIVIGIAGV